MLGKLPVSRISTVKQNLNRECFEQQPGRRFVYGFSVTVDEFQLFYFDRSGAVEIETIDIHQDAVIFVQLVRFLAHPNLSTLGFDPRVYWDGDQRHIDILSGDCVIKYDIDNLMFQHRAIFGSGTICWVARETGTKTQVVIKDKWRGEEFGPEADLLTAAEAAGTPGIACLLVIDEAFVGGQCLTTSSLRESQYLDVTEHKNRVFSRVVLELYGPSIRNFKSGLQLLQAFRDSIESTFFCALPYLSADMRGCSPLSSGQGWHPSS